MQGAELRFNGDTKGLWMPRESTRRRFVAGGVLMVWVLEFHICDGVGVWCLEVCGVAWSCGDFGGVVTLFGWLRLTPWHLFFEELARESRSQRCCIADHEF